MQTARRPARRALLLWSLLAMLPAPATRAAAAPGDLVEMEVLGVVPLEAETASLLILRQKGAHTVLPIFVGRPEGVAIEQRLKQPAAHRPQGPDLLAHAIEALGAKVSRIAIDGAHAALFSARVTLQQGSRTIEMEARPSDSVALAIASHAPIYATRHVVDEAGLTEDDLAHAGAGARKHRDPRSGGDGSAAGPEQSF